MIPMFMALTCSMRCNNTKIKKSSLKRTYSSSWCSSKLHSKVNSLVSSSNYSCNSRNINKSHHKTICCKRKNFINSCCKILKPKLCGTICRIMVSKILINQWTKIFWRLIWVVFNNSSYNNNFNFSRLNSKIYWLKHQSLFKAITFKQTLPNQSLRLIPCWTRLSNLIKIRL